MSEDLEGTAQDACEDQGGEGGQQAAAAPARDRSRGSEGQPLEFSAPCPGGFEQALGVELKALGCARVRPLTGSVSFVGSAADAMRACLWSRLASRVTLILRRVDACDAEELYEGVSRIPWEQHIRPGATIAVRARGGNDDLHDLRYVAMRVKDAVCDRMRERTGNRPSVDTRRPDLVVTCAVHGSRATVGIDLSGEALVNRGYRVAQRTRGVAAPGTYLREDLANFVLAEADWPRRAARDGRSVLVDPLGSSATLAVEAACIACDRAPGLTRRAWGFMGWAGFDQAAWDAELACARDRFERGKGGVRVVVACPDAGIRAEIEAMSEKAGVRDAIRIVAGGPADVDLGDRGIPSATIACVVPDEGTFGRTSDLPVRIAALAALSRTPALAEAPVCALAAGDTLSFALLAKPERSTQVMNGADPALVSVYPSAGQVARLAAEGGRALADLPSADEIADEGDLRLPARDDREPAADGRRGSGAGSVAQPTTITLPDGKQVGVLLSISEQFAGRLRRVARLRRKWAAREGVSCYRVYDADVPEYALSVDLYQGGAATPGRWAVVSEYAAPRTVDPVVARQRVADALAIIPPVLDLAPEDVFLKVRKRERGGSQYAGGGAGSGRSRKALVEEGGLVFEVNFTDYLDTGLFLDHRLVRSRLRDMAQGGRFLNLFAYTGTASCYAASGGAISTTSVDLSATYLDWARRNLDQNGFGGAEHELVQADVMPWVGEQRHSPMRWDLIFVDPPTFSNSARMRTRGFDVQRDHAELLIGCSRILRRGGTIVFSCNLRGFRPDEEALAKAGVAIEDVTESTIPEDFGRNARVHHCYLVRRSD